MSLYAVGFTVPNFYSSAFPVLHRPPVTDPIAYKPRDDWRELNGRLHPLLLHLASEHFFSGPFGSPSLRQPKFAGLGRFRKVRRYENRSAVNNWTTRMVVIPLHDGYGNVPVARIITSRNGRLLEGLGPANSQHFAVVIFKAPINGIGAQLVEEDFIAREEYAAKELEKYRLKPHQVKIIYCTLTSDFNPEDAYPFSLVRLHHGFSLNYTDLVGPVGALEQPGIDVLCNADLLDEHLETTMKHVQKTTVDLDPEFKMKLLGHPQSWYSLLYAPLQRNGGPPVQTTQSHMTLQLAPTTPTQLAGQLTMFSMPTSNNGTGRRNGGRSVGPSLQRRTLNAARAQQGTIIRGSNPHAEGAAGRPQLRQHHIPASTSTTKLNSSMSPQPPYFQTQGNAQAKEHAQYTGDSQPSWQADVFVASTKATSGNSNSVKRPRTECPSMDREGSDPNKRARSEVPQPEQARKKEPKVNREALLMKLKNAQKHAARVKSQAVTAGETGPLQVQAAIAAPERARGSEGMDRQISKSNDMVVGANSSHIAKDKKEDITPKRATDKSVKNNGGSEFSAEGEHATDRFVNTLQSRVTNIDNVSTVATSSNPAGPRNRRSKKQRHKKAMQAAATIANASDAQDEQVKVDHNHTKVP